MRNRPSVMAVAAAVAAVLGVTACTASSASGTSASGTSARETGTRETGAPGTGAPRTGGSAPRGRPEPACTASQLTITLTRKDAAVMGEVGGYLRFANNGPSACQIGGWPAVTAVTAAGKTITAARAWHGTMLGAWRYVPPLYNHVHLPACTSYRGTTEIQFSAVVPLSDLPH